MLSLWLDRSSASLEELIPSHQQCAVDAEVDALITAIRRATDAAFLTEFASDGAANLATNEKNRNVAPATFIPSQHHSLDPALHEDRLRNLFAQGLFSLTVPRDCGGFDASLRDFAMCMEALGAMGPAWAMTAVPHLCISVKAVARYAEPRQRTTILNNIRDQHRLLAFAITEEQGSDVAAMRTRLQKSPNGGYRLSGRKQWITNLRRASHVVVACLCPDLHNAPGASVLVLVDLQQTGVNIAQPWRKVCVNGSCLLYTSPSPRDRG